MTERTVQLTINAIKAAKLQRIKRGDIGYLRLGIKGGSCSGYSYVIEWADEKHARDLSFEFDGLQVIVDPKSIVLLDGATLDYKSGLMASGFEFSNPNATSKCGCGESFSVDAPAEEGV